MKFWELTSVCRTEPELMERLAARPEWAVYLEWYRAISDIVQEQDRAKLDATVPHEACVHVLSESTLELFESEKYIRSFRLDPTDSVVTAVEVLNRYGGEFLEDVLERSLAQKA